MEAFEPVLDVVATVLIKIGEFIYYLMDSIPVLKRICYCIPLKPAVIIVLLLFLMNAVLRIDTLYYVLMGDLRMDTFKTMLTVFLIDTTILIIMVAVALNTLVSVIKGKGTVAVEVMTFSLLTYIVYSAIMMALSHHRYLARDEFNNTYYEHRPHKPFRYKDKPTGDDNIKPEHFIHMYFPYGIMDYFIVVFYLNLFVNAFVFFVVNCYRNSNGDDSDDSDD